MEETYEQISRELSLWKPQKLALRAFSTKFNSFNLSEDLDSIKAATDKDFDTNFPSFTFDMATGSGKTRLMGACLSYLFKNNASRNFFVLSPGEIIYKKLIDEFTVGHPKFVLQGWSDIPQFDLVTGENYEYYHPSQQKTSEDKFTVFVFNIDKFRRRKKKSLKFFSFKETLGSSFGELISKLPDLVLLMDESHHYRAELTKSSIEELHPVLGLEFTATPVYTKNIIYKYSLATAVRDNIVKRIVALVRKNDRSYNEELDELKLRDGLIVHEQTKVWLKEFYTNFNLEPMNPLAFVSTKNIAHGTEIQEKLESLDFENGKYRGKTLFVHSGSEDEQISELLNLENPENTKEIVIHVNKLKEGWDVKNIFTIIPLRASVSTVLTEQTIGRGVRLPYHNVTRDQIEEYPHAFTLNLITFSGKDDNYKEIADKCLKNNIIVKEYNDNESIGDKNLEIIEINPTETKFSIDIPKFTTETITAGKFTTFEIEPSFEKFEKTITEIESIALSDGYKEILGKATQTTIDDHVKFLIQNLMNIDEIEPDDKSEVVKIVEQYLSKASKSKTKKKWEQLLISHGPSIFEEIKNKISHEIRNSFKVKHTFDSKGKYDFHSYSVSKSKDDQLIDKNDSANEKTKFIFKGFKHSIYKENKFDSKQEIWLAKILDDSSEVKKWFRNPSTKNGVGIKYKFGTYYPDFFVETKDVIYVVEVKDSSKLNDFYVIEKAKEAIQWSNKASKITKNKWVYGLIPHDQIKQTDSFDMIKSYFVDVSKLNQSDNV